VVRIDLQDHLAHRDRLDEEPVLRVALGGALERLDRVAAVAEPAIRLAGALGPLRVIGLDALELEVGRERALVLAGSDRGGCLFAQGSTVLGHAGMWTIPPELATARRASPPRTRWPAAR
jgi:hypothetical protein